MGVRIWAETLHISLLAECPKEATDPFWAQFTLCKVVGMGQMISKALEVYEK